MPNYLTRQTLALVQRQYEEISRRLAAQPGIVRQAIESGGGTHDNAMYDSALQDQEVLVDRAKQLSGYLKDPVLIESMKTRDDVVTVAKLVTVRKVLTGESQEHLILGPADKEFLHDARIISLSSPLGRQLLGHQVGESVDVQIPAGTVTLEIISIERWNHED